MARRLTELGCVFARWSSRVFSVELDGAPFYFGLREEKRGENAPLAFPKLQGGTNKCYSLLVCSSDRIRREKCYWELKDRLLRDLPPGAHFSNMLSFLPDAKNSLIKGYFLKGNSENSSLIERLLGHLEQHDPVLVCSYSGGEDDLWTQHVWTNPEREMMEVAPKFYMVPAAAPTCHPSTLNMINSDVFYSLDEACDVLKEVAQRSMSVFMCTAPCDSLLPAVSQQHTVLQCGDIIPEIASVLRTLPSRAGGKPDFPVIVIEGLDATGKTTLTESLRDTLGATLLRSPPQCLSPWRAQFDQEPPLIRRAFYALGNYITAEQICQEGMKAPVIVDRFWHSTAAYAIATAVSGPVSVLPQDGSEVYRWPSDLLQPSLVVLLTLDPEERKRRLRDRGQTKTDEEQELDHNQLFRLRVEEAYQRIRGPVCVTVDASPSADLVLQQVLLLIRAKCHL